MESSSVTNVADDAASRTVHVTNISPQATNKTVTDFFAFCGTINSLTMRTQPDSAEKVQEAVIEFQQEAATKTALLLTNALIIDRPINVSRFTPGPNAFGPGSASSSSSAEGSRTFSQAEIENKPHELPASERTQTSVIASLIAAGYQLAAGSLESARAYDEKYAVSEHLKNTADTVVNAVKTKSAEIDAQYKISETASSWYKAASDKIAETDKSLGVSATASAVAASANQVVTDLNQNPTVQATSAVLKTTGDSIASYADQVSKDVQKRIEENPTLKDASDYVKETVATVTTAVEDVTKKLTQDHPQEGEGSSSSSSSSSEHTSSATTSTATTADVTSTQTPEVNPAAGVGTDAPLEKKD